MAATRAQELAEVVRRAPVSRPAPPSRLPRPLPRPSDGSAPQLLHPPRGRDGPASRRSGGPSAPRGDDAGSDTGEGVAGEAVVLADRPDGTVVRLGPVVSKAHAPGTDPAELAVRLRVAAHPGLDGVLLPPLPLSDDGALLGSLHDGRPASLWPFGTPVAPDDPDAAPWEETAVLLARLHAVPPSALPGPLPPARGPAKVARALARLRRLRGPASAAGTVLRAGAGLPSWARGEGPPPRPGALCHGDLHLGQLVRHPGPAGRWLLIDVDDLGLGDPAWDLARPAAWYAAGLLDPGVWDRFLGAYREARGPAVPRGGDPWPRLEVPARALTVQTAALALVRAEREDRAPDEVEEAVIDACARIVRLPPGPG